MSKFDTEYYMMSVDGKNSYPLLAWGSTSNAPFRKKIPIDKDLLNLPMEIVFTDPYPKQYEMADLLMLGAQNTVSEKFKNLLENERIYGVQFFPVEIKTDKGNIESGHFAMHLWNRIPAIDKNNYQGSEVDEFGYINILDKFSLDPKILEDIPREKRLVFRLAEDPLKIIVHQSIYEAIKAERLTGMVFFRVDQWDTGSIFP